MGAGAHKLQKRALEPLELEFLAAVSCLIWVLGTKVGSPASSPLSHFSNLEKDTMSVHMWRTVSSVTRSS